MWNKPRVLLIGFSLGAEVLPFMVSRAPPDVRAAIAGLVLLSPGRAADFQFHISDWLGSHAKAAPHPLAPELQKIPGIPLLCVYGADEAGESLCPSLKPREGTRIMTLAGDHHFDGDYRSVTAAILAMFAPPR